MQYIKDIKDINIDVPLVANVGARHIMVYHGVGPCVEQSRAL